MKSGFKFSALRMSVATALVFSGSAYATNGMLMEGYGAESTAMGGASMAFDNGTAAMVNNPATLSFMAEGTSRFDLNLGNLRPDVDTTVTMPDGSKASAASSGDSYIMPAVGWVTRRDVLSYGVGVFSQGGMGTDYADNSPLQGARSEIGVGALLAPVSMQVNDKLNIGGTFQYVWGGMDLIMGMPIGSIASPQAGTFVDFMPDTMVPGATNSLGSASGGLLQGLGPMVPSLDPNASAVFKFSNSDDFSGKAKGAGLSGKIGFTYQISPQLTVGGAYQLETSMDDWEGDGTMNIVNPDGNSAFPGGAIPGEFIIKDFQFPSTISFGMAYRTGPWLLAGDVSQINWSDVMDEFNMTFRVDGAVPGFANQEVDVTMLQEWDDQTVVKLGAAYQVNEQLVVRGGANLASNPIPDKYMNPLFPAIIENHYTLGATYAFGEGVHTIGGSLVVAPEVSQTNSQTQVNTTHSQTNLQLLYAYKF